MTTAFQKVYTKITQITKATCTLNAQGVGNDELAIVDGRLAQVVKIWGNDIKCIENLYKHFQYQRRLRIARS